MSLTNGDFETGDLTGWTLDEALSDTALFTETVDATAKHSGSYGWHCHGVISSGDNRFSDITRYQIVDLTGIVTVPIWINFSGSYTGEGMAYFAIWIQDVGQTLDPIYTWSDVNGFTSGWQRFDIDVAGYYAGNCKIQIDIVVQNGAGGTVDAQFYIDDISLSAVPNTPVASFTADDQTVPPGSTVTFTDTSTNTPTSWSWEWDDGTAPGTTQNPSHVFSAAGTYHVVLTATNEGGSGISDPVTITVSPTPVASFTKSLGTDKLTVTFTDTSINTPTSWDWDFGDGTAHGTTQNPVHTYPKFGNYTIILIATNAYGSDTLTKSIYVGPLILSASVQDGITELMARATIQLNEPWEPQDGDRTIAVVMKDHTGTDQTIFYGVIPKPKYTENPASALDQATHNAFSMMYYLSRQHPAQQGIKSTATYNESTGAWTFADPAALILTAIGGASGWSVKTNLYPKDLDEPGTWTNVDDPAQKVFEWTNETTWADALSQIADYYQMLLITALDPTQTPCRTDLYFIDNTQIDTLYPVPAAVEFTYGQKWGPVDNLIRDLSPADEVNTVTIWGYKNTATERFTSNSDPVIISLHEPAVSGSVVAIMNGIDISSTRIIRVTYDNGTAPFTVGKILTGPTGSGTISVIVGNTTSGYMTLISSSGTFLDNQAITDNNGTPGSALVNGNYKLVEMSPYTDGVLRVDYDGGTVAFNVNSDITSSSGGSGTIWQRIGDWKSGTLLLKDYSGTFANDDTLTDDGTPAGEGVVNGTPASDAAVNRIEFAGLKTTDILYIYYTPSHTFYQSTYPHVTEYHALGAYNPSTTYAPNDVVTYLGSSFVCIQNATGVTPVAGAYWVLYFKPLECPIEEITIPDDATIDPQTYVDTYCYDKYTLLVQDAHIYRVIFDQRCDLRKYQKIKFTGWTIPNSWMRITDITYDMDGNGFVKVTVDCVSDRVFLNKLYMKRMQSSKPINVIQSMIDASIAKQEKEQLGDVVAVMGTNAIAKTPDGTYYQKPAV